MKVGTQELSHVGRRGEARMVDVGAKEPSSRRAVVVADVKVGRRAAALVRSNRVAKGNVLEVARIAGICAAKKTAELIPLCHPLPLDVVEVACSLRGSLVHIEASAAAHARTGVEMEALTAATVAALTVYDMLKAVEKGIEIGPIYLVEKTGGKSGPYRRKTTR